MADYAIKVQKIEEFLRSSLECLQKYDESMANGLEVLQSHPDYEVRIAFIDVMSALQATIKSVEQALRACEHGSLKLAAKNV